ncbi:hypothetical protein KVV02_004671 [Mortierella alpina]|uniref:Galactose oxidase n=1 Tax=Mortierella alpina TaxID=64518 RepID=A0A9P8A5Q4_MORAP|nr:hypothetical protein KVV02_004671 [Mortierella alpina]
MSTPSDHRNFIRHILLCLCILSCFLRATAQSYTTLDEKTLYFMPDWASSDFFSLDLTRSWNAAEAPLQLLPSLPLPLLPGGRPDLPFMQISPLVVNKDKKSLIYFDSNRTPSVYNITTKTWQLGTLLIASNSTELKKSVYSNQVATDPNTGTAYILSMENLPAFENPDKTFTIYTYNVLQGYTTEVKKTTSTPGISFQYTALSAVWSTIRKSVLIYGSHQEPAGDVDVYTALLEYQPLTNKWTSLKTQGTSAPGYTRDACMASAYNGTKIVIFGTVTAPFSVFILDVRTLVWTIGAAPKLGQERNGAVCTVVDNYFIVAGGALIDNKQRVLVYNIKLNQWTDTYEAPHGVETASPVAEQERPSGEGMPLGAKIGIIAGGSSALVIFLTYGAFLIRRQKMRRSSHTVDTDRRFPKSSTERTENNKNSPNNPPYLGEDMNPYSSSGHDRHYKGGDDDSYKYAYHAPSPLGGATFSRTNADASPRSMLESTECRQQQHVVQHTALREAPSPSPDGQFGARSPQKHPSNASSPSIVGLLQPQAARNPQHYSSSIATVAVQQWQCVQQGQNPRYIAPSPSVPTTPMPVHYPLHDPQDYHAGRHDRSDHRAIYHDQRRDGAPGDRNLHNHTVNYCATYYDRHANDPQACYRDPNDAEDYHEMYQSPRMNAPQDHGHSSTGNDLLFSNNQRRLDPQDPTRHSTASRLEFYQSRRLNNPQDHGDQDDQDDDTLYQDIQRTRAQQEEHLVQQQNLEGVRLEKEAKLHTLTGCSKHPPPQGHSGPLRPRS